MVHITYLLALSILPIVWTQVIESQPELETQYTQAQFTPAIDPNNPWANYQSSYYYPYQNVDRQGILNNPEALAIGAVAVGGAVGLGGLGLGLSDTRQTLNRVSDRQNQICSTQKEIISDLDSLLQAILSAITVGETVITEAIANAAGGGAPSTRQAMPADQVRQLFNSVRSSLPTASC